MSVKSYFIQRSANAIRKVAISRFPSLRDYDCSEDGFYLMDIFDHKIMQA